MSYQLFKSNHRKRTSAQRRAALSAIFFLAIVASLLAFIWVGRNSYRRGPPLAEIATTPASASPAPLLLTTGLELQSALVSPSLFRYSVIPGGVRSAKELAAAIRSDSTVARHYAGFNERSAHVLTLHADLLAYVSYRIGQEIYWTKKPVTLRKNETVITDGTIEARTRCGNRVSVSPQLPVSPKEPAPETLDAVIPQIPEIGKLPMALRPNLSSLLDLKPIESGLNSNENADFDSSAIPATWWGSNVPTIILIGSVGAGQPSGPVATPEPGTGVLLLVALLMGLIGTSFRRGRQGLR
jgi:hypothetical protein